MQTLILTLIVLGVIVFIHELGHFLTAKWCGVAVPRFSIGLGPRVVGVQIGGTDYCLSAVPFGGYVKMVGMEGEEAFEQLEGGALEEDDEANVPPEQRFDNKSAWQRLLILSAGVTMNFLMGWAIYVGLAAGDGIATVPGTQIASVDSIALERFDALEPIEFGSAIASIEGQRVTNWYEINTAILASEGAVEFVLESGEEISVSAAGESERRAVARAFTPLVPPVIAEVESESPAAVAGLQRGDRIVAVDGIETTMFSDVVQAVRERPGQIVPITIVRTAGGEEQRLSMTVEIGVEQAPRASDGRFVDTGWLGVAADVASVDLEPVEAIVAGSQASWRAGSLVVGALVQLVTGEVSLRSLGGPVAIGQLTGHFARQGWNSLMAWVAIFSINLAILNLLPIPVLDGGHILFLGIETLRGRPLSSRQKLRLSQVGLAFLVLLMAWAFTADILRLVGV